MMVKYKQSDNKTATNITLIKLAAEENQLATPPEEISNATQNIMQAAKSPEATLIGTEIFRFFSIRNDEKS